MRFPCVRAAATTPVQRLGVFFARLTQPFQPSPIPLSGRPAHRPFRGLLGVYSRCGRTLAPSPIRDLLHRRLQPFRHLHDCSGCFRLERSPGGALTHWKAPPSHGAHVELPLEIAGLNASSGPVLRRIHSATRRAASLYSLGGTLANTHNATSRAILGPSNTWEPVSSNSLRSNERLFIN